MPSQASTYKAACRIAAEGFGRMLRRWRELNGWSQYTMEAWAKAAGFTRLSHGGMSPLELGKIQHPQWATFNHLAEVNRRLVAKKFDGVKRHELRAQLEEARPMVDDAGQLLEEEQLFGTFYGLRRIPAAYWVPASLESPALSEAEALRLCESWRDLVAAERSHRGVGLLAAMEQLGDLAPDDQRVQFQNVLCGDATYSPEQLQALWDGSAWLPATWVAGWLAGPKLLAPAGGG